MRERSMAAYYQMRQLSYEYRQNAHTIDFD